MGFRRFLLVLAVPSGLALAASCAPLALTAGYEDLPSGLGTGGGPNQTSIGTTSNGGSLGGLFDGGGLAPPMLVPSTSFLSLCGGSQAACTPGAGDVCAQGGNPGMGGSPADGGQRSCLLVPPGADAGADAGVSGACLMSGVSTYTCTTAADCEAEYGCVVGLAPTCRHYCCDSVESCPAATYCVPTSMNEAPEYLIPVCIPVTHCQLLPDSCPDGQACAIVRADGTTSCVTPGTGTEGQACPCAKGYTCTDGACFELCNPLQPACPLGEICQGGTQPYSTDFVGYCVK